MSDAKYWLVLNGIPTDGLRQQLESAGFREVSIGPPSIIWQQPLERGDAVRTLVQWQKLRASVGASLVRVTEYSRIPEVV